MKTIALQSMYSDKRAFVTLTAVCVALFCLYIYFVSASVVHVVLRTEVGRDVTLLSSEISELEGKYIEGQHKVSADIASLQGYEKIGDKIFIKRTEDSLVLRTDVVR